MQHLVRIFGNYGPPKSFKSGKDEKLNYDDVIIVYVKSKLFLFVCYRQQYHMVTMYLVQELQ